MYLAFRCVQHMSCCVRYQCMILVRHRYVWLVDRCLRYLAQNQPWMLAETWAWLIVKVPKQSHTKNLISRIQPHPTLLSFEVAQSITEHVNCHGMWGCTASCIFFFYRKVYRRYTSFEHYKWNNHIHLTRDQENR